MQKTRTPLIAVLSAAALSVTLANTAMASSYIHSDNSEKGYKTFPEHFQSDKTRAQVQAEAVEFLKNGGADTWRNNNYSAQEISQSSTKTREQVQNEYLNESPEQRRARLELYRGRIF